MDSRLSNIGQFTQAVTLVKCHIGRGSQGQKTVIEDGTIDALAYVSGTTDEVIDYSNLEAQRSLSVSLYKVSGMTTRWQVRICSKTYQITAIDPVSRYSPVCVLSVEAIDGC